MAGMTYYDGDFLATVPPGTKAVKQSVTYKDDDGKLHEGEAYVLPPLKNEQDVRNRVSRLKKNTPSSATRDPGFRVTT